MVSALRKFKFHLSLPCMGQEGHKNSFTFHSQVLDQKKNLFCPCVYCRPVMALVFFQLLTAAFRICDLESLDNTKLLQYLPTFACLPCSSFCLFFRFLPLFATSAFLEENNMSEIRIFSSSCSQT